MILTDFHHASLLNSLILLFRRLGKEVYRPIGREWYTEGFWKVYNHPATVAQYLDIGGATPDKTPPLNSVKRRENDVYECFDISSHKSNKAITLEGFLDRPFEVVIASIPQHIEPFARLCKRHLNNPKLIYQIGNNWNVEGEVKNVMASAKVKIPEGINCVMYHQEFELDIFKPVKNIPNKIISSFVNCFNSDQMFRDDWNLFLETEKLMTEAVFSCYGAGGRDGWANGHCELAQLMQNSMFIWHTKKGGDGYGHIIYNASAVGRPLVVKEEYYLGKMGEELMIDGDTCIAIDGLTPDQIVNKMVYFSRPDRYQDMCGRVYANFCQKVDFELESEKIGNFLKNLL